ncbi:MAG: efflux RND transporter periplasmic adaptor subunit, partial [Planctomycetota bacterium]
MSYRAGVVTGALFTAACVAAGWALLRFTGNEAAGKPKEPALAPPATVATTLKEEQINTIVLSDEAVKRLALRTEPVTRSAVHRVRIVGGEVLTQPGHTIIVSAPVAAVLKAPDGKAPLPGQSVRRGQPMFELQPLLSPEGRANLAAARLEAEGQVRSADTNLDAATVALDRAKRVFAAEAGSRRAVDEAQAQFDLAVKALDIAKQRLQLLSQVVGEVESGTAGPIMVRSPCDGLLRDVLALPGQNVPSGASLFEVVDLSRVWVRVPVYVGDLPQVNADAPAAVGDLTARPGALPEEALPVSAPPSADPNAGTVDL